MKIRPVEERDFECWLNMRYALWFYHTKDDLKKEMEKIYKSIGENPVYHAEDYGNLCGFIEIPIEG